MSHHGLFFALCLGVGMALGGAELALDSIRIRVGDLEGLPYLEPSMYSRLETTTSGESSSHLFQPATRLARSTHDEERMLKSTLEHSSHGREHEQQASAEEKTDKLEDPTEILMARQLDPLKVGVLIIILVIITVGLEITMERVPELLDDTGRALLDKVYKELAILGLLSFLTFISEVIFKGTASAERPWVISFEYAHLLLFCMAIIYIARAGVLVASIRPMRHRLQRLNDMAKHDDAAPSGLHRQISIAERYLCFDLFRSLFIRSHDLPRQFLFDRYLSYCYKRAIRDAVDIKPHAWMAVIAICAVDIGVSGLHPEMARGLLGPVHFLGYGWLILLVDYGLFAAVHRAHWEVEHYLSEHTTEFEEEMAEQGEVLPQLDGRGSSSSSSTSGAKKRSKEGSMVEIVRRRREAIRRRSARSEDGDAEGREGGERLMLRVQQAAEKKEASAGMNVFRRCIGWFDAQWRDTALHVVMSQRGEVFRTLQDTVSLLESLYLASYLTTYAYHAVTSLSKPWGVLVALATPLPPLICVLVLSPLMITRYLLVRSTVSVDEEALDLVVDYMTAVEDVFLRLQGLMAQQEAALGDDFLLRTFEQFDVNGDGTLSHDEFKRGLRLSGLYLNRREMGALLRFVDEDFSDSIDLQEFSKLLLGTRIFMVKAQHAAESALSDGSLASPSTPHHLPHAEETKEPLPDCGPVKLHLSTTDPGPAAPHRPHSAPTAIEMLERARSTEEAARRGMADGLWGSGGGLKRSLSSVTPRALDRS